MPLAAPHACATPRCPRLAPAGKPSCPQCETGRERERGSAAARGYGARWRKYRAVYLRAQPLCILCLAAGRTEPATVVDHTQAHKGDEVLFWDPENHRALCKSCHDARTDEGDFGNDC